VAEVVERHRRVRTLRCVHVDPTLIDDTDGRSVGVER
jgi:hypothetical protein